MGRYQRELHCCQELGLIHVTSETTAFCGKVRSAGQDRLKFCLTGVIVSLDAVSSFDTTALHYCWKNWRRTPALESVTQSLNETDYCELSGRRCSGSFGAIGEISPVKGGALSRVAAKDERLKRTFVECICLHHTIAGKELHQRAPDTS